MKIRLVDIALLGGLALCASALRAETHPAEFASQPALDSRLYRANAAGSPLRADAALRTASLLRLQRSIGNQYVARLFAPPPPPVASRMDVYYLRGGGMSYLVMSIEYGQSLGRR